MHESLEFHLRGMTARSEKTDDVQAAAWAVAEITRLRRIIMPEPELCLKQFEMQCTREKGHDGPCDGPWQS